MNIQITELAKAALAQAHDPRKGYVVQLSPAVLGMLSNQFKEAWGPEQYQTKRGNEIVMKHKTGTTLTHHPLNALTKSGWEKLLKYVGAGSHVQAVYVSPMVFNFLQDIGVTDYVDGNDLRSVGSSKGTIYVITDWTDKGGYIRIHSVDPADRVPLHRLKYNEFKKWLDLKVPYDIRGYSNKGYTRREIEGLNASTGAVVKCSNRSVRLYLFTSVGWQKQDGLTVEEMDDFMNKWEQWKTEEPIIPPTLLTKWVGVPGQTALVYTNGSNNSPTRYKTNGLTWKRQERYKKTNENQGFADSKTTIIFEAPVNGADELIIISRRG